MFEDDGPGLTIIQILALCFGIIGLVLALISIAEHDGDDAPSTEGEPSAVVLTVVVNSDSAHDSTSVTINDEEVDQDGVIIKISPTDEITYSTNSNDPSNTSKE